MKEQILSRLGEALHIALGDLPGRLDRFHDLLTDIIERVDAVDLLRVADDVPDTAQPSSRLAVAALSKTRGEPVTEFLLIPFGEVVVERPVAGESFVFTPEQAESAKLWFDQMNRKLAVDYEHQSFERFNTRGDGLRPAAGWIGGLDVRDDGLWAVDVTWTERAAELLRSGEYRYFSPVIFWKDEDHTDIAALGPVALTNDPAMRGVRPLAAARELTEALFDTTPEGASADDQPSGEHPESMNEPALVARAELDAAQAEIELLRKQLAVQDADAFVERGLRQGKILDSTGLDWREDYLRAPELTEERLARAPVILPPGRVIALDRRGEVERRPPGRSIPQSTLGRPGQLTVEPEDLAAFERATAAGRVLGLER